MATSKPGYGAVPPPYLNSVGAAGQVLTASGMNGSMWSSQTVTTHPNAIQIGTPEPTITFHHNGDITTKAGTITAEDWISVVKVMKQLIMDMSQDEELVSKYPYIRDAAHNWMMNKLKGE
jgi:phage gpG-like protein